ncbi:Gfo/Idh/MocA family oxidoreductase [Phycicoccus sp. HDW14]|uniref:Gfo/Idh/MocA family protein n=1 Tax=Phycicoccus sp. HDW14 TaxID=2714941 RepID=UPI0035300EE3
MTRVGLAGYGFAGRDIHARWMREAGLDVVAVSTRDDQRSAAARSDLPGVEVVAGLDELLAVDDLDLVVLATPSGGHAAQVRQVLDTGVPCVVDKPLAVDSASAAEVVRHAEAVGVPLTVFQNRRYDPSAVTLRGVVAAGLVGQPFRFEMRWERWRPVPKDRWRENAPAAEGGGLLLDLHSHLVDAAVTMFGRVERVAATLASRTTVAEDDAFVLATHTSGVVSHLSATSVAAAPGPRVRLLGREGAYVLADFEGRSTRGRARRTSTRTTAAGCTGAPGPRPYRGPSMSRRPTSTARWRPRSTPRTGRPRCPSTPGTPCTPWPSSTPRACRPARGGSSRWSLPRAEPDPVQGEGSRRGSIRSSRTPSPSRVTT